MTFEQWFDSLDGGYESYKDLLQEAWSAATEEAAKVVDEMADYEESEREPSAQIQWTRDNASKIRRII